MLRSQGVQAPRGLWTRRGLTWLTSVRLATDLDELQRDILQERLQSVASMIQRVERVLNRMAEAHAGVQLLRTIPGVGRRTGEAVVAYIDGSRTLPILARVSSGPARTLIREVPVLAESG